MKRLNEQKLQAFHLGSMGIRTQSRKEIEVQQKREEEQRLANAYKEFVDTFQDAPNTSSRSWEMPQTHDIYSRRFDGDLDLRNRYSPPTSSHAWESARNYDNDPRRYVDRDLSNQYYPNPSLNDRERGGRESRSRRENFQKPYKFQEENLEQDHRERSPIREPKRRRKKNNKESLLNKPASSTDNTRHAAVDIKQASTFSGTDNSVRKFEGVDEEQLQIALDSPSGEVNEARINILKAFIITRGPDNVTYSQGSRKIFVSKRNIERLSKIEPLAEGGKRVLEMSKTIMENKELIYFVERQKLARERLAEMGVEVASEHELLKEAYKRASVVENEADSTSDKRRKSAIGKLTAIRSKLETSKPGKAANKTEQIKQEPKVGTSGLSNLDQQSKQDLKPIPKKSEADDVNSLKLVLVDDDSNKGRVETEVVNQVELKILESFVGSDVAEFNVDTTWENGKRVYTCLDEETKEFMLECFKNLDLDNRNIMLIPYEEREYAGHERAWIWVNLRHIKPETFLNLLQKQNRSLNIQGNWTILKEGKKRDSGQFFLLQIHRESIPTLKEKNFEMRIGFGITVLKLEDSVELGPDEEPHEIIDNDDDKEAEN